MCKVILLFCEISISDLTYTCGVLAVYLAISFSALFAEQILSVTSTVKLPEYSFVWNPTFKITVKIFFDCPNNQNRCQFSALIIDWLLSVCSYMVRHLQYWIQSFRTLAPWEVTHRIVLRNIPNLTNQAVSNYEMVINKNGWWDIQSEPKGNKLISNNIVSYLI